MTPGHECPWTPEHFGAKCTGVDCWRRSVREEGAENSECPWSGSPRKCHFVDDFAKAKWERHGLDDFGLRLLIEIHKRLITGEKGDIEVEDAQGLRDWVVDTVIEEFGESVGSDEGSDCGD